MAGATTDNERIATLTDLSAFSEQAIGIFKEALATQHQMLQQEIDRRFESADKEHKHIADFAAADRASLHEYLDGQIQVLVARLDGMDRATTLLDTTVHRVPTEIQLAIGSLGNVIDERFKAIEQRFLDTNAANSKAIDKAEDATGKAIEKQGEVVTTLNGALSDKIDDVKQRLTILEGRTQGVSETEGKQSRASALQIAGITAAIALLSVLVIAAIHFIPATIVLPFLL